MFREIAVAHHESPEAEHALARAIQLANGLGAELSTISVAKELPAYTAFAAAAPALPRVLAEDREKSYSALEGKARAFAQPHGVDVQSHIEDGREVEGVVSFLPEKKTDLLVARAVELEYLLAQANYIGEKAVTTTQTLATYSIPSSDRYGILTTRHLKALSRFVRRRTENNVDADDIVQDTLLLACRHIGQFRWDSSVGTWLSAIAVNVMKGRWRRQSISRTMVVDPATLDLWEPRDTRLSPLVEAEQNEVENQLHDAIATLPAQYRTVVELRDFQGLTLEETANRLATSVPAIKSRHYRAKRMLKERLSKAQSKQRRPAAM